MTQVWMACIVEGHGEVQAVPILIRRIAQAAEPALVVHIKPPIRQPRSRLVKAGEIERAVELAARSIGGRGAILTLLDSDDDCPAKLGPHLLQRARAVRGNLPIGVVLAEREYEAWFLAAAESIAGQRQLSTDLIAPTVPEEVRGAKEWLRQRMPLHHPYSETVDQPALTAVFDLDAARRADSFDKCYRDICRLLRAMAIASRE
ncbi:MAG: DUF4276 family protein [Dehalococcoidia bacterium]